MDSVVEWSRAERSGVEWSGVLFLKKDFSEVNSFFFWYGKEKILLMINHITLTIIIEIRTMHIEL